MSDFVNIFKVPELKKRLLFTGLILIVYRLGSHIPTPGIDAAALGDIFASAGGTLFGFFDLFSGGALRRASIFALGIMPYIDASIILQLLAVVVPYIERLHRRDPGDGHIHRAGGDHRGIGAAGGAQSRLGLSHHDYPDPDRRQYPSHVAGRADFRAGDRQWDFTSHLCRDHCSPDR
jgi:hypothetical protein